MVYPSGFHRLVIGGTLYGTEDFNTTVSIVPSSPGTLMGIDAVSEDLLEDIATIIGSWWPSTVATVGPFFTTDVKLTYIKLNHIGVDGRYTQSETREHVYTTPISGGYSASHPAAQLSLVHTIETGEVRGLAARGRMFLPPSGFMGINTGDGRIGVSDATNAAKGLVNLLGSINGRYATEPVGDGAVGKVGVASNTRSGAFRVANGVSVGRVLDTIRSRRSSLEEERILWPVAA